MLLFLFCINRWGEKFISDEKRKSLICLSLKRVLYKKNRIVFFYTFCIQSSDYHWFIWCIIGEFEIISIISLIGCNLATCDNLMIFNKLDDLLLWKKFPKFAN